MAEKKYVERRTDPDAGRATLLALAPRGQKALATARRFHRRFEAEWRSGSALAASLLPAQS